MSADPAELRRRMVDKLTANDYVIPHWQAFLPWCSAFLGVPRHALIPGTVWITNGAGLVPLCWADDPRRWLDLAYSDDSVITQVDDGHPARPDRPRWRLRRARRCPISVRRGHRDHRGRRAEL